MRVHLWYTCCGTLTCGHLNGSFEIVKLYYNYKHMYLYSSYLQCLHLTPNIMLLQHTWHVWESQDLVENLQWKNLCEIKNFSYYCSIGCRVKVMDLIRKDYVRVGTKTSSIFNQSTRASMCTPLFDLYSLTLGYAIAQNN